MARLYRFVKLSDRFDTQVFTFVLPNKITREFSPDIFSKEFTYGYQKWNVSFVRSDKHLGSYLRLQTPAEGMTCRLDFSFTMLNKEHFTRNESYIEKSNDFTPEQTTNGRKAFIPLNDLTQRQFLQTSGEFLVELEMRNMLTFYECCLRIPKDIYSKHSTSERLESSYFSFGLSDWSLSIFPDSGNMNTDYSQVSVQLHRHTSLDHLSVVRYKITLGLGLDGVYESDLLERTYDASGAGEPYLIGASLSELAHGRSKIRVKVEMHSVVAVSEVVIYPFLRDKNRAHCYDRDKQAWMVESDISGKYLMFRLYYTDISHVPRKFTRCVCWNVNIIPVNGGRHVNTHSGPHCRYYVQQDLDEGYIMHTGIRVDEVRSRRDTFSFLTCSSRVVSSVDFESLARLR